MTTIRLTCIKKTQHAPNDSRNPNGSPLVFTIKLIAPIHRQAHKREGEFTMKRLLVAFVTLAFATVFTAPAFAGILDAKDKAECEKAGGVWVEKDNKCGAKKD